METFRAIGLFILGVIANVIFWGIFYYAFKGLSKLLSEETAAKIFGISLAILIGLSIILGIVLSVKEIVS